jgi:Phosphoesterase family
MARLSRRGFLGAATAITGVAITGAAAIGAAAPAAEAEAGPARGSRPKKPHGDIRDIKRVVILMQENRSFDHYYGSLRGVRGFGDRATITLPGGLSVFEQPTSQPGHPVTGTQFPWRLAAAPFSAYPAGHQPPSSEVGAQNYGGTDHSWETQHTAWYGGLMNAWYTSEGGTPAPGDVRYDNGVAAVPEPPVPLTPDVSRRPHGGGPVGAAFAVAGVARVLPRPVRPAAGRGRRRAVRPARPRPVRPTRGPAAPVRARPRRASPA